MARFDGKVALVTGATSGIGRATALAFARAGGTLVAAGRREREGQRVASIDLRTAPGMLPLVGVSINSDLLPVITSQL